MNDIEILRYVLGGIGLILLVMLFWFGRSDKKNNSKNYKSFRESTLMNNEGAEPFLSEESFNLDLNETEIKALAHSVENNKEADNLFEDVDAFYENVVKDQEKVRDGITPMPMTARKPVVAKKEAASSGEPVSVPAWLQQDKPQVQEQVREQNDPGKIDTVGLFKPDDEMETGTAKTAGASASAASAQMPATAGNSTAGAAANSRVKSASSTSAAVAKHPVQNEGQEKQPPAAPSQAAQQEDDENPDSPRHSGILPLSSLVNRDRDNRKKRNPYLEGFQKHNSANTSPDENDSQAEAVAANAQENPAEQSSDIPLAAAKGEVASEAAAVVVNSKSAASNGNMTHIGSGDDGKAQPVISVDEAFLEQQQMQDQEYKDATRSDSPQTTADTVVKNGQQQTRPVQPRRIEKHQANFDITFYLVAGSNHNYTAADISKAAEAAGLVLVGSDTWSRMQNTGTTKQYIFNVTAHNKECAFDGSDGKKTTSAVVFEVNAGQNLVSRAQVLDSMIKTARNLERELGGELVDIGHCKITDMMVMHLRRQVEEHDRKLSH